MFFHQTFQTSQQSLTCPSFLSLHALFFYKNISGRTPAHHFFTFFFNSLARENVKRSSSKRGYLYDNIADWISASDVMPRRADWRASGGKKKTQSNRD